MYVRLPDGSSIDSDFDFLAKVLAVVDRKLEGLPPTPLELERAEQVGLLDAAESFAGLGFIACQGYLTVTAGPDSIGKSDYLRYGPVHSSGRPYVSLLNAAANFAKHRYEAECDRNAKLWARTIETMALLSVTPSVGSYPLTNVLAALVKPAKPRFCPILPLLIAWREQSCAA